jgi:hypothetical protein
MWVYCRGKNVENESKYQNNFNTYLYKDENHVMVSDGKEGAIIRGDVEE